MTKPIEKAIEEVVNPIRFKLAPGATLPTRGTTKSAGLDLYSPESFTIPPSEVRGRAVDIGRYQIDTGVSIELPEGMEAEVRPRSGLAFNKGVDGFPGTIDADYRQSIGVLLYNYTSRPIHINKGDRIAQLVISKYEHMTPVEYDEIEDTDRGGFGSTGK